VRQALVNRSALNHVMSRLSVAQQLRLTLQILRCTVSTEQQHEQSASAWNVPLPDKRYDTVYPRNAPADVSRKLAGDSAAPRAVMVTAPDVPVGSPQANQFRFTTCPRSRLLGLGRRRGPQAAQPPGRRLPGMSAASLAAGRSGNGTCCPSNQDNHTRMRDERLQLWIQRTGLIRTAARRTKMNS
jgi:hypothetical protein